MRCGEDQHHGRHVDVRHRTGIECLPGHRSRLMARKQLGAVPSNNADAITKGGSETLLNKTLTAPKINSVKDTNGNNMLVLNPNASAANYFTFDNAAAGGSPAISANGSDTDISFSLCPAGAGAVIIYANTGQANC